jgi:hypothetical protein
LLTFLLKKLLAWVADNQYGHTKRATGLALTNMIGQVGLHNVVFHRESVGYEATKSKYWIQIFSRVLVFWQHRYEDFEKSNNRTFIF